MTTHSGFECKFNVSLNKDYVYMIVTSCKEKTLIKIVMAKITEIQVLDSEKFLIQNAGYLLHKEH